jgi:hypothetical protein
MHSRAESAASRADGKGLLGRLSADILILREIVLEIAET